MKNSIQFSVVIATHDRLQLLGETLASLCNQTLREFEVIVSDDSCRDDTKKLVESFKDRLDITYLASKLRKGGVSSRNYAAVHARAPYLALLDDDDFWAPEYLATLQKIIEREKVDMVVCAYNIYQTGNGVIGTKCLPTTFKIENFLTRNPGILCSNVCVSKDVFYQLGGYDEYISGSADKDMLIRLATSGYRYFVLQEPLVYWRTGHSNQWSSNNLKLIKHMLKFYSKYFFSYRLKDHYLMLRKFSWMLLKGR